MSNRTWRRPHDATRQGRDATLAQVIDTIDQTAPPTKAALAEQIGISEQYASELLQDLKADNIVRKGYVVDNERVYQSADIVSRLNNQTTSQATTTESAGADANQTHTGKKPVILVRMCLRVTHRQVSMHSHRRLLRDYRQPGMSAVLLS